MNRKHTKYDENVTSFQCETCGKEFRSSSDLKEHMISHAYQNCSLNVMNGIFGVPANIQ